MMRTKDIMTTQVVSVTPRTSVAEVAGLLLERHISALPVIDADGKLVGIVSEGDFLRRAEGDDNRPGSWWLHLLADSGASAADYVRMHGRTVADVMTRELVTVTEDTPVGDLAHLLETKRIKRVPVLRDGKVVGIVSRADLLRGLAAGRDREPAPVAVTDEAIRENLLQIIATADWAPTHPLTVVVVDGIVRIWGFINTPQQADALRVAAENVPGVKDVELNVRSIPAYVWSA